MAKKSQPSKQCRADEAMKMLGITKQDLDTLIEPARWANGSLCSIRPVAWYQCSDIDNLKTDPRLPEMREAKRLADIEDQRKFDLTMTEGDFDMYIAPLLRGDVRRFQSTCEARGIATGEVLRDAILKFLAENG